MQSEPLTGARHVARVIDARVRRMLDGRVPQLSGSWSQRVPEVADPELRRYLTELAAAMDDRVRRLGEHAVQTRPAWAIDALGDVPGDPAARADLAGDAPPSSAAYRELYGYDSKTDAIGPEPGKTSPEARADWHAAFAVLGRVEGIDLRGCTDAQLRLRAPNVRTGNQLGAALRRRGTPAGPAAGPHRLGERYPRRARSPSGQEC